MANAAIAAGAPSRPAHYGSISRDRRWALRWSYFFLVLFAIFFLMPPFYMLITSLKSSAEISAATNPWWVFGPTLDNYIALLTNNQFLTFFRNSAVVSICVVAVKWRMNGTRPRATHSCVGVRITDSSLAPGAGRPRAMTDDMNAWIASRPS